jgi:hypothetical protein
MIDRWKLTSYCSCNPSTTRGHFEKSSDELAVWVLLSDHEAEVERLRGLLRLWQFDVGGASERLERETLEALKLPPEPQGAEHAGPGK